MTDDFPIVHNAVLTRLFFALIVAIFGFCYFHHNQQGNKKPTKIWMEYALVLFVSMLTFSAYYSLRILNSTHAFNPNYPSAREVAIDIEVIQYTSLNTNEERTFAIVIPLSHDIYRIHKKERIFLSAKFDEAIAHHLRIGTQLRLFGLHRYFSHEDFKKPFYQRLSHKRIYSKITHIRSVKILSHTPQSLTFFQKLNVQLQSILSLGAPHHSTIPNIYLAMLLGEKEQLLYEQKRRFMETGTMHLFAVSGLHIGIITLFIAQLFSCLRIPKNWVAVLTLPLIFIFIQTIGCPPSALRAFIMISVYWLSLLIKRQPNAFSALTLSAVIILCIDPWQIHSLGFQLSFSVVTSILLFGLPLNQWVQSHFKPFPYLPKENWSFAHRISAELFSILSLLFAISFSAWLGSLPLCLQAFGYVSTSGIIANIILIQIASLVILTGICSLILGLFHLSNFSEFINHAAWLLLKLIDSVLLFLQTVPFPVFESDPSRDFPAVVVMLPYFTLLYFWHYFPKLLRGRTIWIPPLIAILSSYLVLLVQ